MSRESIRTVTVGLLPVLFGVPVALYGCVLTFILEGLSAMLLAGLRLIILGILTIRSTLEGANIDTPIPASEAQRYPLVLVPSRNRYPVRK